MKSKLFGYMLLLAFLLLITLMAGLFLLGQFDSTEKNTYDSLDIQMEVFEKYLTTHFDRLAASAIRLSVDTAGLLDAHFAEQGTDFSALNGSPEQIGDVQRTLYEPLRQKMLQEDCSGIFMMLDATVDGETADSVSRTGLYIKRSSYKSSDQSIWLYRGIAQIGRQYGSTLHCKWQLEFSTERFPDYGEILSLRGKPTETSYFLTDCFYLDGTSDKAMLMVCPVVSADGTFYGICGYEISADYFMIWHAQPSKIRHLTCLMTTEEDGVLDPADGLSCGVSGGYFREPKGMLTVQKANGGMQTLTGDTVPYIGVTRQIRFTPNNDPYTLAVMMMKADYDRAAREDGLKMVLMWLLFIFFTLTCCLYLSRRFLSPILKDLERIKSDKRTDTESHLPEIEDLFAFLEGQDRSHDDHLRELNREKELAQDEIERLRSEYEQAQSKYEAAQAEIARLAYSRKQEVDPDNYRIFLDGIQTLTPQEKNIFGYYLEGKTVKEIIVLANIKESTLRYHNRNIYSKLGVNSLKQLLRYAALMHQEEEQTEEEP